MLVATHYTVSLDIGKGVYVVRNKDAPMCPECGVLMSGYDHRKRKAIGADGKPRIFLIRRLRCPVCRQIHAEIPDSLIPYKHYASEVIKTVQQGDDSLQPMIPQSAGGKNEFTHLLCLYLSAPAQYALYERIRITL